MTSITRTQAAGASSSQHDEPAALQVSGISKQYGEGVLALDHVDLTVLPGQVFGLLGPNGAGKTTLLRIALGLIQPSSGASFIMGERMRPSHPVL
ncbi:MAG TPA: ATP-binding cassette domain-containing protein, partial [Dehalococcoidia bacterium]|nr:ATP-binding cassette domain-containing protein [Dehalococcoidia bacterium]